MKMKLKLKPLIFLIIVLMMIFFHYRYGFNLTEKLTELHMLSEINFLKAAVIYFVITVAGCVVLALPGAIFAAAAGFLFEPFTGTILCLSSATFGAVLSFLAGRYFLKDSIRPYLERNNILKKILFDDVNKSGIFLLMITRLVPLFPYNLQNFAYGLTDIDLATYTICTFIFMFPGAAAFTFAASGIINAEQRGLYILFASVLIIFVILSGFLLKKFFLR